MYTGGTPAVLHKLCTECLLGAQMGRNLIRVQICYANVIALVLGEVNFTMAACKLKLHSLNSKLLMVLLTQYSIPDLYRNIPERALLRSLGDKQQPGSVWWSLVLRPWVAQAFHGLFCFLGLSFLRM